MKIEDAALMNFLWAWEVMRRIGFRPDEIYMVVVPPGRSVQELPGSPVQRHATPTIGLEIRRDDGKTFRWVIGPTALALDDIEPEYERAIAAWNANDLEGTTGDDFKRSLPFKHGVAVVQALQAKGMLPSQEQSS